MSSRTLFQTLTQEALTVPLLELPVCKILSGLLKDTSELFHVTRLRLGDTQTTHALRNASVTFHIMSLRGTSSALLVSAGLNNSLIQQLTHSKGEVGTSKPLCKLRIRTQHSSSFTKASLPLSYTQ